MLSFIGVRRCHSAFVGFSACVLLNSFAASGDQIHVLPSASMGRIPRVELDDRVVMEDGLIDQDDLVADQDEWVDDRKISRARGVPAASTIMRRQAEVAPDYADEMIASEALERPIRPHSHAHMQKPPHEILMRPEKLHIASLDSAPVPSPLPGNVELTLSWREPREELPALLAEVARARKQELGAQPSDKGSTPAPASDQDVEGSYDNKAPSPGPSPMPKPSGDDSTKGLGLFIVTLLFLCGCCGGIGTCVWYFFLRPRPLGSTSSAAAPLLGEPAETAPTRSYRERRKKGDKEKDAVDNAPVDEGTKGETGGSSGVGETGGSNAKTEEPAKVEEEEEEEQHF